MLMLFGRIFIEVHDYLALEYIHKTSCINNSIVLFANSLQHTLGNEERSHQFIFVYLILLGECLVNRTSENIPFNLLRSGVSNRNATFDFVLIFIDAKILKIPTTLESSIHREYALVSTVHSCPNKHIIRNFDFLAHSNIAFQFCCQILSDIFRGLDFIFADTILVTVKQLEHIAEYCSNLALLISSIIKI